MRKKPREYVIRSSTYLVSGMLNFEVLERRCERLTLVDARN